MPALSAKKKSEGLAGYSSAGAVVRPFEARASASTGTVGDAGAGPAAKDAVGGCIAAGAAEGQQQLLLQSRRARK
jgi:hypothetical protein